MFLEVDEIDEVDEVDVDVEVVFIPTMGASACDALRNVAIYCEARGFYDQHIPPDYASTVGSGWAPIGPRSWRT